MCDCSRSRVPFSRRRSALLTSTLEAVQLFQASGFSERDYKRLADLLRHERFAPGQTIFEEGDAAAAMFVVVEGAVRFYQRGEFIREMGAGAHFGELALLAAPAAPRGPHAAVRGRLRTATAVADGDEGCSLLALSKAAFDTLFGGPDNPVAAGRRRGKNGIWPAAFENVRTTLERQERRYREDDAKREALLASTLRAIDLFAASGP